MANSVSAVLSESFDDVLSAVQETARGRWFLDEFAKRQKSTDTSSILAAIAKLESVISAKEPSVDAGQVAKARAAIAAAKAKLNAMDGELPGLSNEGRMFAKLAEMSRAALSGEKTHVARGVDVALTLVDELDQSFGGTANTVQLKPAGDAYFNADKKIFAPATSDAQPVALGEVAKPAVVEAAKPAVVTMAKPTKPEEELRGAKLTINRVKSTISSDDSPAVGAASSDGAAQSKPEEAKPAVAEPVASAEASSPEVPAIVSAPAETAAVTEPVKSRITIIRRKAEEVVAVPLVDELPPAAISA